MVATLAKILKSLWAIIEGWFGIIWDEFEPTLDGFISFLALPQTFIDVNGQILNK